MRKHKSMLKRIFLQQKVNYTKKYGKDDVVIQGAAYLLCSGNDAWTNYITKLINS